jgi:predicted glycoside hydrolase/deacetylase ChbG (UPF0249 family)
MSKALIVNADDLGYDPAVTRGIVEAMDRGIVTSTTLMVNGPHSEAAASLARGRPVGLHLNLARWRPAWAAFPAALLDGGELAEARAGALPAEVVEREALAQLDRLEALLGARASHLDVHKHLHRHPGVLEGVLRAAAARRLPVRAIDEAMRQALRARAVATPDGFIGDAGSEPYWTLPTLRRELEALPEGLTELMCHPGYAPVAVRSGYATQREVELQTFTHSGARRLVERLGIRLVNFSSLGSG